MTRASALLLPVVVAASMALLAQAPADSPDALVVRAGRYVEEYEKAFSAIVCEERQTQRLVRPNGSTEKQRELVSDFLLVKAGGERLYAFRDVLQVDGRAVRNRQERLRKLFIESSRNAVEQAQAISKESGRYNIGFSRSPNSPLMPLHVLHPRAASGFHFTRTPDGLAFEEFRSPSLVRQKTLTRTRSLFSRGHCAIDPETGRVLSVALTAGGLPADFEIRLDVRYAAEPALGILVPVEFKEECWRPAKPRDSRLIVVSTYSNFRRFQVTTEEQIKIPK